MIVNGSDSAYFIIIVIAIVYFSVSSYFNSLKLHLYARRRPQTLPDKIRSSFCISQVSVCICSLQNTPRTAALAPPEPHASFGTVNSAVC